MNNAHTPKVTIWRQPAQVWAVAFACVIAFMGIGLVDPILPAIAESLERPRGDRAALHELPRRHGSCDARDELDLLAHRHEGDAADRPRPHRRVRSAVRRIGKRRRRDRLPRGWGLGNALFISTALATIVGAASADRRAIILYEAALGLGIAIGPLLGGILGEISWRGPFFGVVALMAIAFIAVLCCARRRGKRRRDAVGAFQALRQPGLGGARVARSSTTSASSSCWPSPRSRSGSVRWGSV
jgi:MFS family permease